MSELDGWKRDWPWPNDYSGPGLARWLEEEGHVTRLPEGLDRIYRHWRSGVNPTEESVDAFCCRSEFLHLDDIPAWAVLGWPPRSLEGLRIEYNYFGRRMLVRQ